MANRRSVSVVALGEIERNRGKGGALDLERGERGVEGGGGFQPVGRRFELRGISNGLAGRGVGDGVKRERLLRAANRRDDFECGRLNADEFFHFTVEDVGSELAGGGIAHEFDVVGLVAEDRKSTRLNSSHTVISY